MSKHGKGRRHAAAELLDTVATALNACRDAGITVHLRHDTVITDVGYVLPTRDGYTPRTLAYLPFTPGTTDPDDD